MTKNDLWGQESGCLRSSQSEPHYASKEVPLTYYTSMYTYSLSEAPKRVSVPLISHNELLSNLSPI